MGQYTHILLAADFNPESEKVVHRAKALATNFHARLSIVHVLEPISIAYGGEFPVDLGDLHKELEKQAKQQLCALGEKLNVAPEHQYLEVGITEKEILRVAKANGVALYPFFMNGVAGNRGLLLADQMHPNAKGVEEVVKRTAGTVASAIE